MLILCILLLFILSFAAQCTQPVHSQAGRQVGVYPAAFLFLGVGSLSVLVWSLLTGVSIQGDALRSCPWYVYGSAIGNIAVVGSILYLIPRIGVGILFSCVTIGQFVAALVADNAGLASEVVPITPKRLFALALIIAGALVFTFLNGKLPQKNSTLFRGRFPLHLLLATAVGAAQTLMDTVNARAGALVGAPTAVFLYLTLGAVTALLISILLRPHGLIGLLRLRPLYWLPGILNVLMVGLPVLMIPLVGIGLYTGVRFLASTTASILFDRFGWMGLPKIPMRPGRAVGAALMFCGVVLML